MPRPSTMIPLSLLLAMPIASAQPAGATVAASEASRPHTCLVLSGGGARGIAHIGVLKVLEELRVPVDCIVGTSMGSIIGGAYASGTPAAEIERLVRGIAWDRLLRDEAPRAERSMRQKELERRRLVPLEFGVHGTTLALPLGAVAGQQLEEVLRVLAGPAVQLESFDELPIRFRAVATDIETGRMIVLDRGSVTTAMRASMSVPGVFTPQARDGRLLIDGGLVRNLPIDVARQMGAERIIAVNLGTPLLRREQLDSLFGVTQQMLNILTEQNVTASLAQLRPGDVLIQPELGAFSAAGFADSIRIIEIGERGARAAAGPLAPLAVSEDAYAAYLARRAAAAPRETSFENVVVDTAGLDRVSAGSVKAIFDAAVADREGPEALRSGTQALYATDDFELIGLRVEGGPESPTLVVEPREKGWGPAYANFGLTLSTDAEGESKFNVLTDVRATWLNRNALEWRADASIGDVFGLDTELRQPLDARRRWFVSGGAVLEQRLENLFFEDQSVARYRSRGARAIFDLGRFFSTSGEARIGYEIGRFSLRSVTGLGLVPEVEEEVAALHARFVLDRLDDWSFPSAGYFAGLEVKVADDSLGGELDYERYQLDLQKAFGFGDHSIALAGRFGESRGTRIPFIEVFDLGGFQTLSGASERRYLGRGVRFGRIVYRYQLDRRGRVARRWYLGGSLEAGRMDDRINGLNESARLASSMFLGADTLLGPFYLGGGIAEGGDSALYLFLGRP